MSDTDCTPGREPRNVAASFFTLAFFNLKTLGKWNKRFLFCYAVLNSIHLRQYI